MLVVVCSWLCVVVCCLLRVVCGLLFVVCCVMCVVCRFFSLFDVCVLDYKPKVMKCFKIIGAKVGKTSVQTDIVVFFLKYDLALVKTKR